MPSSRIVRAIHAHTQKQLLPSVPKRWTRQFQFGLEAYALRPFQSATGNARMVGNNTRTAVRKSERLFANAKLTKSLGAIFDALALVHQSSYVNVDHSDMNGLLALAAAIQTRKGRAVPCMVEATYSDRKSACRAKAQMWQHMTKHCIASLQAFRDRLGFWPRLVFDRGFGNESMVTHLHTAGAIFYIRLKAGRAVEFDGQMTKVKHLRDKDATARLFGLSLRVVRSPKSRRAKEPWYILTNDFTSSRAKIMKIYYHRFEIEETFRGIKHIWELKRTRLKKPGGLKVILWFVSIGIALLHLVTKPTKQPNPKKQTSWLRQAYEQLQQAYGQLLWGGV